MKFMRYACVSIIVCISVIVILGSLDWLTKYIMYVQQRTALYDLIQAGREHEALKRTVAYLQGSATRTLDNLKTTCLYLAPLFLAALYIYRKG